VVLVKLWHVFYGVLLCVSRISLDVLMMSAIR
jgi:hypothetical protein